MENIQSARFFFYIDVFLKWVWPKEAWPLKCGNNLVNWDGVGHKLWQSQRGTLHTILLQKSQGVTLLYALRVPLVHSYITLMCSNFAQNNDGGKVGAN